MARRFEWRGWCFERKTQRRPAGRACACSRTAASSRSWEASFKRGRGKMATRARARRRMRGQGRRRGRMRMMLVAGAGFSSVAVVPQRRRADRAGAHRPALRTALAADQQQTQGHRQMEPAALRHQHVAPAAAAPTGLAGSLGRRHQTSLTTVYSLRVAGHRRQAAQVNQGSWRKVEAVAHRAAAEAVAVEAAAAAAARLGKAERAAVGASRVPRSTRR